MRTLSYSSGEPGSVISIVSVDNPEAAGTPQTNPVTLTEDKLVGKAVKVMANGRAPLVFITPPADAKKVDIKVRQLPTCPTQEQNRNRPMRLLMKAYQALTSKDYEVSRGLAIKATEIDPTLAAPHIIVGLGFYQQGRKDMARLAFNKAQALDPEDQEIVLLLRLVQQ